MASLSCNTTNIITFGLPIFPEITPGKTRSLKEESLEIAATTLITGQMPFRSPGQQFQSIEEKRDV